MENKIKRALEEKKDNIYTKKQIKELNRILREIKKENSKFISEERLDEIIEGKRGRLEKADNLEKQVRKNNHQRRKLKFSKATIIAVNIHILLYPILLTGGISYVIMNETDKTPYHQNDKMRYEMVTEYKDSLNNNYFLEEEDIAKYGKNSLILYSPYEETQEGTFERRVFKMDRKKNMEVDEIIKKDPTDIIAKNKFKDIEIEESNTLPDENNFLTVATSTYEDKENFKIKQNSKEQITKYSLIHSSITLLGSGAIYAIIKAILKKTNHKYILDKNMNDINFDLSLLPSKEKIKEKKQKIKNLRKKEV